MAGVTADAAAAAVPPEAASIPDNKPPQPATNGDGAQPNKARKPRRERLPLPDPIPETPVKRYPEPNRVELQKKIDTIDTELQACFDRLNSTRAFNDQRQKIRESGKSTFDATRKAISELNDECRVLFEKRKVISNKLKEVRDALSARNTGSSAVEIPGAGKDGNDALKNVRTLEELDQRVEDLQYRMETESLPIAEEKKIVNQIAFLQHKGRDFIRERAELIKNEKNAKEARIATRKELEEARKAQDIAIDAAKAKLEEQKKILTDFRAGEEAKIKKLQDTVPQIDKTAERKKISELKTQIKKMREDFEDERDQWYLNERVHYEQQKIAKRKRYEEIQAEREARRKAWEAEQAQYPEPHPYQEEKDMCSGLIVYLQTLLGKTVDKPNVNLAPAKSGNAPSLKTNASTREISSGGKAIGKKNTLHNDFENLAFSDYVRKGGKRGKKARGRSSAASIDVNTAETQLKPHSIDYLAAFTRLDVKPPNKISEVQAALEAVKEKATYYETAPAPSEEEKAKKTEAKQKKPSSDKKAANGSMDLSDVGANAFPGLHSETSGPSRSRDSSLPSFKAVASGIATAPPPTPAASAVDMPPLHGVEEGQLIIDKTATESGIAPVAGAETNIRPQSTEPTTAES
ncbi:Nuclear segregation protein Bfr1 [Gracilaria domingensis]|nr:Nuclear segregation protein Bfr1 [Gracilaria domingensis]